MPRKRKTTNNTTSTTSTTSTTLKKETTTVAPPPKKLKSHDKKTSRPPPPPPLPQDEPQQQQQQQQPIDRSTLLLTIHSELTNLGKSLTCPLCLHTLSSPSLLPCVHAFCQTCITRFFSSSSSSSSSSKEKGGGYCCCCPVCKLKCTKRSIIPSDHLSDLVLGYKKALRAFGMVPIVYSESIEMTQIPREMEEQEQEEQEEEEKRKKSGGGGECLKACHEHLEVSRTMQRVLESASAAAAAAAAVQTDDNNNNNTTNTTNTTSTSTTTSSRPSIRNRTRSATANNKTKKKSSSPKKQQRSKKSEEIQQQLQIQKLQLLAREQQKVVQVDEKALIQAAVCKKRASLVMEQRNNNRGKEVVMQQQQQQEEEEEGYFVPVEEEGEEDVADADNGATDMESVNKKDGTITVKNSTMDKNEESSNKDNKENDSNQKKKSATETQNDTAKNSSSSSSSKQMIMVSSQEMYDISANDAREKEAADRSGEWILEELEQQEQQQQQKEEKEGFKELAVSNEASGNKDFVDGSFVEGKIDANVAANAVSTTPTTSSTALLHNVPTGTPENTTTIKNNNNNNNNPLKLNTIVQVQPRTWPGVNKPGGVARITKIHNDSNSNTISYDVAYVLGGREKNVDDSFVCLHEDGQDDFASPLKKEKENGEKEEEERGRRSGRRSTRKSRRSLSPPPSSSSSFAVAAQESRCTSSSSRSGTKRTKQSSFKETTSSSSTSVTKSTRRSTRKTSPSPPPPPPQQQQQQQQAFVPKGKENDVPPEVMALIEQMEESSSGSKNTTLNSNNNNNNNNNKKKKKKKNDAETEKGASVAQRKKRGLSKRHDDDDDEVGDEEDSCSARTTKRIKKSTTAIYHHHHHPCIMTDAEKVELAEEWYKHVLFGSDNFGDGGNKKKDIASSSSSPKGKVINLVTSSLSEYEKDMVRHFCLEMKRLGVTIKENKDFHPGKTIVCITPSAAQQQHRQNSIDNNKHDTGIVSKYRTLKAMRAALACIPIVTINWIAACLEEKSIVCPKGNMCIQTLPTKLECLLSCKENNGSGGSCVDGVSPTARFGVSNYASLMYKQQQQQQQQTGKSSTTADDVSAQYLPLENTLVFLSGKWQKKALKKSDVQILLRESGASILTSASMTTKALKEMQKLKLEGDDGDGGGGGGRRTVVILCDESTTDQGCGISGALLKELKTIMEDGGSRKNKSYSLPQDKKDKNGSVLLVNPNWLFDCVTCGSLLGAGDYEPSVPVAKSLWKLCMEK